MKIVAINPITINHQTFVNQGHSIYLLKPAGHYSDNSLYTEVIELPSGSTFQDFRKQALALHARVGLEFADLCCDQNQEWLSKIALELGLLTLVSDDAVIAVNDKLRTRQILREKNIDPTRSEILEDAASAQIFFDLTDGPVIIKPRAGLGSRQVHFIETQRELDRFFELEFAHTAFGDKGYIIEECLEGIEYSVEFFSEQGRHFPICVTAKYKNEADAVEIGHVLPARLETGLSERIFEFVTQVLTALDVKNGPTHTEIFFGPKGPRLVETHCRFAGDFIPELIRLAYGIDLIAAMAKQSAGASIIEELSRISLPSRHAAVWYAYPKKEGQINTIQNEFAAENYPTETQLRLFTSPGCMATLRSGSLNRLGACVSVGDTFEQALAHAQRAIGEVGFSVV